MRFVVEKRSRERKSNELVLRPCGATSNTVLILSLRIEHLQRRLIMPLEQAQSSKKPRIEQAKLRLLSMLANSNQRSRHHGVQHCSGNTSVDPRTLHEHFSRRLPCTKQRELVTMRFGLLARRSLAHAKATMRAQKLMRGGPSRMHLQRNLKKVGTLQSKHARCCKAHNQMTLYAPALVSFGMIHSVSRPTNTQLEMQQRTRPTCNQARVWIGSKLAWKL